MKKAWSLFFLVIFSSGPWVQGDELPDWFTPLRDAVYSQELASKDLTGLYNTAREQAAKELSGAELSVMYSRCEYMMGRAVLYEENSSAADAYFSKGMSYAQESLDKKATAEGWQMLAENLSQLCTVRSTGFVMANGRKVEQYSNNALALDPGNTAAQFMVAARWVYAPAPFRNLNKGIQMMQAILSNFDNRLYKDDRFNVYSSIGYAYIQQKKKDDAKPWLIKSLQVYPDNKYIVKLLAGL